MKIFKHYRFSAWANAETVSDAILKNAVTEMQNELYEANLGAGLYKKRVAMDGKGKRGGYRTLLAFQKDERAFFIYGFAKWQKVNISRKEKVMFKLLAKELLKLDSTALTFLLREGRLVEVT